MLKNFSPFALAIAIAVFAVSVDLHNAEVQAAAMVIVTGGFVLGIGWPAGAWRWALILGLSIVVGDPMGVQLGIKPPWPETGFNPGSFIALVPAFIGTYAGVLVRRLMGTAGRQL